MDWGDKDCCGCLVVVERGDQADLACNECGAVVRTVLVGGASAVILQMASGEICGARCPLCDALNMFPGFAAIEGFICSECGESVVGKRSAR